jgi:hypothetical protein
MYPAEELIRLSERKAALRRSIARRRIECATLATEAARPLAWLDRAYRLWQKLSPFIAGLATSVGSGSGSRSFSRVKMLFAVARMAPSLFRMFSAFRTTRSRGAGSASES